MFLGFFRFFYSGFLAGYPLFISFSPPRLFFFRSLPACFATLLGKSGYLDLLGYARSCDYDIKERKTKQNKKDNSGGSSGSGRIDIKTHFFQHF